MYPTLYRGRDREPIIKSIRQGYPPFKSVPASSFEFGFKIRDKNAPKDWCV